MYFHEFESMEWDIIFTGECCNIHVNNIEHNKLFYKTNYGSRGTCMYILNKGVFKKLYDIFNIKTHINVLIFGLIL